MVAFLAVDWPLMMRARTRQLLSFAPLESTQWVGFKPLEQRAQPSDVQWRQGGPGAEAGYARASGESEIKLHLLDGACTERTRSLLPR
jgi:hypothetical protein